MDLRVIPSVDRSPTSLRARLLDYYDVLPDHRFEEAEVIGVLAKLSQDGKFESPEFSSARSLLDRVRIRIRTTLLMIEILNKYLDEYSPKHHRNRARPRCLYSRPN